MSKKIITFDGLAIRIGDNYHIETKDGNFFFSCKDEIELILYTLDDGEKIVKVESEKMANLEEMKTATHIWIAIILYVLLIVQVLKNLKFLRLKTLSF